MPPIHSLVRRLVLGIALGALVPAAALAEKRVALVIGNSSYQNATELRNPKNDAADMAAALRELGFQVISGTDLDKPAMDRLIRNFAGALGGADVGLFFYAGHGLQVAGNNYLVPVDASVDSAAGIDFELVRLDLIQRQMERETKTNVLFLDACRNNPLARNLARALGTRSADVDRGLALAESGVGTLISFATQPGNVAMDGEDRNSPFTIKHIATPGKDLNGILIAVRNEVRTMTGGRQVPWENSALTGLFYFREAAPVAATPVEPQRIEPNVPARTPAPVPAEDLGNASALTNLAINYETGAGVPKDEAEAARLYARAGELGNAQALLNLGAMHAEGRGVARNSTEAMRLFRKSAELGNADAMKNIGVLFNQGDGVPKNSEEAPRWYRRAADLGNDIAMTYLAIAYANGTGVPKDEAQAARLYRQAAERGNRQAMLNLGMMYYLGRGVAKNYSEAMRFFRKVADLGDTQAMSNIGVMYDNGEGVPKNAAEAARWYKKAAGRDKPAR
jgi:TPR repeat protein